MAALSILIWKANTILTHKLKEIAQKKEKYRKLSQILMHKSC